jgi:phytoene synthase
MAMVYHWESRLLDLANQALEKPTPVRRSELGDDEILRQAYAYCDRVTQENSKTFFMASQLLSPVTRRSVRALYAFCRTSDDIVDRAGGDVRHNLEAWREIIVGGSQLRVSHLSGEKNELVALAWEDTRLRHKIPALYVEQLLDGVAADLEKSRYASFPELAEYCYGVAVTVGLMSMHIIGYSGPQAMPYAIRLGVALQLTNILRDVGEDWRAGRLYLPQDELACFNLSEEDIAQGVVDDRWREFMRFQIARNRQLYAESMAGIAMLNQDGRFAIGAAAELYEAILVEIEKNDYQVFSRRASVSTWGKLKRLPGIWNRSVLGNHPQARGHRLT